MKVIILSLFASVFIAGVFGDEKQDAISAIQNEYNEVFKLMHRVGGHITAEINRKEPEAEKQAKLYAEEVKTTVLTQFANEVKKVSRTAIAKGKPLSTFECIAKTSLEGREQILKTEKDFIELVDKIAINRVARLKLSQVTAAIILNAVAELKDQAITSIDEAKSGIQSLKNDALKKIETGRKQLLNLESSIHKPTLQDEYTEIKRTMDISFKDVKESLFKRLQKCLV